jgi:GTPase SAR1 family protein
VLLVYGNGGIGKTTLARRFRDIADSTPRSQIVRCMTERYLAHRRSG